MNPVALALRRPREDADLFRAAFVEAPVAAALVAPDGSFVEVNRGLEWLLGQPTEALRGRTLADLAPPGEEPIRLADLGREQQERCIVRADGEPLWVAVSAGVVPAAAGRPELHVVQLENIAERRRRERRLRRLADHDPLTWLLNRRSFLESMQRERQRMRLVGEPGALLLLDLDRLKEVNDAAGHAAGDRLLCTTADVLRRRLRSTDLIGRLGGDEFAAWLLDVTEAHAEAVAEDVTGILGTLAIEASVGVAAAPPSSGEGEQELLARADRAMYERKRSRRR